jgi:hypothetical protein
MRGGGMVSGSSPPARIEPTLIWSLARRNEYGMIALPMNEGITGGMAMTEIISSITSKGQVYY